MRATIDQGRTRSIGDNLRIVDGELHGARFASWIRAIVVLEERRNIPLTHVAATRELARFRESLAWFEAHGPRARPYSAASVVGALVYAHRVAGPVVERFTHFRLLHEALGARDSN